MRLLRAWSDRRLRAQIDTLHVLLAQEAARRIAAEERYIRRIKICHCLPEDGDKTA